MSWVRAGVWSVVLLVAGGALAQGAPDQIAFQGRLVRADGTPESGTHTLVFRLYDVPTAGTPLWEETVTGVAVTNGYYALVLGGSAPFPVSLFDGRRLYLGVALSAQSEFSPRISVVSVPYARHSATSEDAKRLGGIAPAEYSLATHTHPNATTSSAGFISGADKAKLNAAPTTYGAGLNLSGGTLTVAAHTHALSCVMRSNTGADGSTVSATCNTSEVLTGGGCESLEMGFGPVSFGPQGITSAANGTGGAGYDCLGAAGGGGTTTARAVCCSVGN